ncbi:uncharacterized protein TM35_000391510 [Trypanosoma theileri]|uniref:Uncharacterized protein n=1 Tax=Trypanosoma theileri TaxID=67003 RepID=A0A1X0NJZ4_9TRYP|nr:uncharacterized protein TM35_000391510 [Trypanosoma theileri]ORC84977.1 hypothetical protein TM35_000391510 [Trypanosoma theileri]
MRRCCWLLQKNESFISTRVFSSDRPRRTPFFSIMSRVRLNSPESIRQTGGGSMETQPLSSVDKLTSRNCGGKNGFHGVSSTTYRRRTSSPYSVEKYRFSRLLRLKSRSDDEMDPSCCSDAASQEMQGREVVLTPSTLLQRLESIFPPGRKEEEKKKQTGHCVKCTAFTASVTGEDMLNTNIPFYEPNALADRLRPCCYRVPWKCVLLSRVDTTISSAERENTRSCSCNESVSKLLTTPAVYDVFVPISFLFDPDAREITSSSSLSSLRAGVEGGKARRSYFYSDAPSIKERIKCKDRSGRIVKSSSKLQRVAVLHHIPGLPDPTAASMTLEDYSQFLQYCTLQNTSQKTKVKRITESTSVMHCMGTDGMNNRDIGIHSVQKRLSEEKKTHQQQEQEHDGVHMMNAEKDEKTLDGGVGVWIIHPYRESIFFALRYTTASDHYEWLCSPQYTLFQDNCAQSSAATVATAAAAGEEVNDKSGGLHSQNNIVSSLSWAITPLQKAMISMKKKSEVLSQGKNKREDQKKHPKEMKTIFPTILYYCAANVPLSTEEKSAMMMSLLTNSLFDTTETTQTSGRSKGKQLKNGQEKKKKCKIRNTSKKKHHKGQSVAQLAMAWTPLPRTSRLMRGRQLMTNPDALAETLKYGLLRILH